MDKITHQVEKNQEEIEKAGTTPESRGVSATVFYNSPMVSANLP